jgi:hypothetical protein
MDVFFVARENAGLAGATCEVTKAGTVKRERADGLKVSAVVLILFGAPGSQTTDFSSPRVVAKRSGDDRGTLTGRHD